VRLGVLGESRRVRKPLLAPWERNRASALKVSGRKAIVPEMQAGRGSGTRGRTQCLAGIRAGLSVDQHVPRKMAGRREFLWSQAREPLFGAGAAKTEGVGGFGCCGDNLLADRALVRANARVCAPACARTLPLSVSSLMAGNGRRVAPSGPCQARAHSWTSACLTKSGHGDPGPHGEREGSWSRGTTCGARGGLLRRIACGTSGTQRVFRPCVDACA